MEWKSNHLQRISQTSISFLVKTDYYQGSTTKNMGSWQENTGAGDMYAATAYVPYTIIYAALTVYCF